MSEADQQRMLAEWLDFRGVLWCHPSPNVYRGALRRTPKAAMIAGARAKKLGVKKGILDVLVFTPPPLHAGVRGVAIELKVKGGRLTPEQREWMRGLTWCGWMCEEHFGADSAIRSLRAKGY